jgi:hypothetical protein
MAPAVPVKAGGRIWSDYGFCRKIAKIDAGQLNL